jgi:HlyD family secretion protein
MNQPSLEELRIDRTANGAPDSRRRAALWLVLLVAVIGLGAFLLLRPRTIAVVTTVARAAATGGETRTVLNASGYVVARREATVSSKVTGKVVEVLIQEGMKVEQGQVLARLDDANVRASLRVTEAGHAAARAALAEINARLEEARKQLARVQSLQTREVASAADLDRAEAEVKSLAARLDLQREQIRVAEAEVAAWQQQLEDTVIRAPFAGVATAKNAQPGEMISPMSAGGGFTRTGIGTIVDMSSLEIEVDVNESFIKRVRPGQAVEATLDAYPEWKIPCEVIAVIPTADRQKATVKVRIRFAGLDPRILPQMAVRVAFKGEPGDAASTGVSVPKVALRKAAGREVVWVVRDGRLEPRPVSVGFLGDQEATLTSGVQPGEAVVVEGPEALQEGARARAKAQ